MLTSMARLPLNSLPAFRTVAQLQNLRAAAESLHLTHSAVSQQIRGLEEQLGFALFERRGRRVVLNAAGEALLRSVEPALAQLDDGVQAAAAAASGSAQRLRVTTLPSFAQRWLLPRIGRWRERHPTLALETDASHQVVDLQREGFHAALRQGRGPWAGLESERLFEGPMPWGPWSTIAYYENWGGMGVEGEGLSCEFPQKWMSADGLTLWCIFSVYGEGAKQGARAHDQFNLLKATVTLR